MNQFDAAIKPWQEPPELGWIVQTLLWGLERAQSLGWRYPDLSEEKMLAAARRKTRLDDFGDKRFIEPLRLRIAYLRNSRKLNTLGRIVGRQVLLKPLINRLRLQDILTRHPEIREQRIEKPLFVIALPRTGTTVLSRLLALDPAARPLMFWETVDPIPRGPETSRDRDPRIEEAVKMVRRLQRILPAMRKIHDIDPLGPEECTGLLATAFITPNFEEDHLAFKQWLENQSKEEVCAAYEEYKAQLQLLQWQHAGGHWVLKSPLHLNWLDALLTVFPDACVVQTHRDPKQVLPSICSLEAVIQRAAYGEADCAALGRHLSSQLTAELQAGMRAREHHPPQRVLDVQYRDLMSDPVAVVRRIYDHFGYEYTPIMERKMVDYLAREPQHKHGSHQYSLEDFGLSAEKIDRDFADYTGRFHIPLS